MAPSSGGCGVHNLGPVSRPKTTTLNSHIPTADDRAAGDADADAHVGVGVGVVLCIPVLQRVLLLPVLSRARHAHVRGGAHHGPPKAHLRAWHAGQGEGTPTLTSVEQASQQAGVAAGIAAPSAGPCRAGPRRVQGHTHKGAGMVRVRVQQARRDHVCVGMGGISVGS